MSSDSGRFEIVIDDGGRRRVVPLHLGTASIGRGGQNTVVLEERNVSREHLRLIRDGKRVWVEDLGSENGSWLNEQRVAERTRIFSSDVLKVGDFELALLGESLRHRNDETTEPNVVVPDAEPTDPTITAEEQTEVIDRRALSRPANESALPDEVTQRTRQARRASRWLFLSSLGGLLLLAVALAIVIVDGFGRSRPGHELATESLVVLQEVVTAAPATDADALVAKAQAALAAGRWEDAERLANAAWVLQPDHPDAERIAGTARQHLRPETTHQADERVEVDAPDPDRNKGDRDKPRRPPRPRKDKDRAAYVAATKLIKSGDHEGARRILAKCLKRSPKAALCHRGMGIALVYLREPEAAAFHYERYIKIEPNAPDADRVRAALAKFKRRRR